MSNGEAVKKYVFAPSLGKLRSGYDDKIADLEDREIIDVVAPIARWTVVFRWLLIITRASWQKRVL